MRSEDIERLGLEVVLTFDASVPNLRGSTRGHLHQMISGVRDGGESSAAEAEGRARLRERGLPQLHFLHLLLTTDRKNLRPIWAF